MKKLKLFTRKQDWTFDISKMGLAQRLLFLGFLIMAPVLIGFFVGLGVDFAMQQIAYAALWGVAIGSAIAVLLLIWQGKKLLSAELKDDLASKPKIDDSKISIKSNNSDKVGRSAKRKSKNVKERQDDLETTKN